MSEEPTGYSRIYAAHHPALLVHASVLTGDHRARGAAVDLAAEAHLALWRQLAAGRAVPDPGTRLRALARELATVARASHPADEPAANTEPPAVAALLAALALLPEWQVRTLWRAERARITPHAPAPGPAPAPPPFAPPPSVPPPSVPPPRAAAARAGEAWRAALRREAPGLDPRGVRGPLVAGALLTFLAGAGPTPVPRAAVVLGPLRFGR